MSEAHTEELVSCDTLERQNRGLMVGAIFRRWWAEIAIITLALLLWVPRLSGPIDLRWDAGVYYVIGTSLATGHGYRILSEPGAPEATQYPPLLPIVVAGLQRAIGTTDPDVVAPWLRTLYLLTFIGYALAVLALAKTYLSVPLALAAGAMTVLQINTIFLSDLLFTEVPFALVSVLFVLAALSPYLRSRSGWRELVCFALAATGFLLRTAGLALLVAWMLEALWRRRWRLVLLRALLGVVPVLAWQAHVLKVRGSYEYSHPAYEYQRAPYQFYNVSYGENLAQANASHHPHARTRVETVIVRSVKNLAVIGKRLGEGISSSEGYWRALLSESQQLLLRRQIIPPPVVLIPILGLSAIVVAGIGVFALRRARLMLLVVVTSIGLICLTPWPSQFQRYLMPLTSFLVIAALIAIAEFQGLRLFRDRPTFRFLQAGAIVAVIALPLIVETYAAAQVFSVRVREGATLSRRGTSGPPLFYHDLMWRGWEQAMVWIDQQAGPNAIVATPYSHLCYLRTGRHAVSPPIDPDPARVRHLLESVPVSYVIVDRGYSLPALEGDPTGWHLAQSFDGARVYQYSGGPSR